MCSSQACLDEVVELGFLQALLLYLNPQVSSPAVTKWVYSQRHDLVLQAISILTKLIPNCTDAFMEVQGGAVLCQFLMNPPKQVGSYTPEPTRPIRPISTSVARQMVMVL